MKVIGIKGNYNPKEQAEIYLMADSSLLKDGKPLFLPDFAESFVAYPALVVRINRLGKNIAKRFAHRYYDAVTIGLCVEAKGFKATTFTNKGSVINAFDGSAVTGDFLPIESISLKDENTPFSIAVNGKTISEQSTGSLTMDVDSLIEELSKYFTFKIGDILFTGYNSESGFQLNINDSITGKLGENEILNFKVK